MGPTFSMGLEDGTYSNLLEGSLSGQLQAGHAYYWSIAFMIDPSDDSIAGLGSGFGGLQLLEFSAVPEPSSIILLGGGFGAIGLFRTGSKRRRKESENCNPAGDS